MKRFFLIVALALLTSISANAQWFDFYANLHRAEVGFNFGQVASFTDHARLGLGGSVMFSGVYVDFISADPQHRYDSTIRDTKWEDNRAFCINAGYQIPILPWLRIMPLVGYGQHNDGLTDASSMSYESDSDGGGSWYHKYEVTPGSRVHYFNYGGGLSVQPLRWFSVNLIGTRFGLYGGIGIDFLSLARQ